MKLIYLSSKKYPASTADHIFIRQMARAFTYALGKDFILFISGNISAELEGTNVGSIRAPAHFRSLFYFICWPFFVLKNGYSHSKTFFLSNDAYLLAGLIFWKRLLRFKYQICSDWHQLFQDWRDVYIARGSDYLISTSDNLKDLITQLSGLPRLNILVARGGVELDQFTLIDDSSQMRSRLGLPLDKILVGYVGFYKTMGMSKGVETMIRSIQFVPDPRIAVVLVGGRPEEIEELRLLAEELRVADRCLFFGLVGQNLAYRYEQTMDILVIPYPDEPHFRHWGFPMKTYEYMASGRPIIYSQLRIIAEVLGDCALSFKAGDSHDLAERIIHLVGSRGVADQLGQSALEKVKNYTWDERAKKIINFLQKGKISSVN